MKLTLQQWRKVRGLSQGELARQMGRNICTIMRWEKNGSPVKATDIAKLEKVLNINWADDVLVP